MVSSRRVRCLVAAVAGLSLASLSTPAHAQPACVAGKLADYLALTGGCTIDRVTFSQFEGSFGAFNVPAQLSFVAVTPFDVGGQVGFNLALSDPLSVQEASAVGLGFAERFFEFDFMTSGVGAGGMLGASPFALFTASVAAAPGGPVTGALAIARMTVASAATGDSVAIQTFVSDGGPQGSSCAVYDATPRFVPCAPLVTTAFADGAVSLVGVVDAWGAANAPASASLANLGVAIVVPPAPPPLVTPEPRSVPLVATGLGLLGVVGARRRRRVAPIRGIV
jgi:hypothetical protein